MEKLKVLDLFSGIGGFSLGLERSGGFVTTAFCEIEEYPRKVLKKHWPDVPIYEDIRELTSDRLSQDGITADLICGGYPCQPFSTAGKRQGEGDDRHLWPEMYRLIKSLRPRWVIAENVAGHVSMGLDAVLSDLEAANYTCWPFIIPACAVDAKHRRDRIWLLATNAEWMRSPEQEREHQWPQEPDGSGENGMDAGDDVADTPQHMQHRSGNTGAPGRAEHTNGSETLADTTGERQQRQRQFIKRSSTKKNGERKTNQPFAEREYGKWPTEPPVGRVAHGIPNRVDRLAGLGNAVVPQIPEIIGRAIMEIENAP